MVSQEEREARKAEIEAEMGEKEAPTETPAEAAEAADVTVWWSRAKRGEYSEIERLTDRFSFLEMWV